MIDDKRLLRKILTDRLGDSDIKAICHDLDIDIENLKGENKADLILELLIELKRKKRSESLFGWIERDRKDIYEELFPPAPTDTEIDTADLSNNQIDRDNTSHRGEDPVNVAMFCVFFFCALWGILTFAETGLIQNLELNWLPLSPFIKGLASSIIAARLAVGVFS